MTTSFTEQEIKFRLPEGGDPARVRAAIEMAGFRLEPQPGVTHEDRYVDTEDWVLFRAGIALRLRADGRRVRLEAKTLRSRREDVMVRTEWTQEAPLADEVPWDASALAPGPVAALLWPLRGLGVPERLRVVARIRAERECFRWLRGEDPLGLLTVDHVALPLRGGADDAAGDDAPAARRFDEVEVELSNGHRDALGDVRRAVEGALGLRANSDSKLASALAAAGFTAPERSERAYVVDVGDRVADVAWKTIARQFGRLLWNEPGTRLGVDAEYLHDMRVASRRLRMALEVFAGALPDTVRDRFADDLRFVGRALGRVRDLDVGMERVTEMEADAGREEREALAVFAAGLGIRRGRRRLELIEALDSERYAGLVAAAREWIAEGPRVVPGAGVAGGGLPAYQVAPRMVSEAEGALGAAYAEAERSLEPEAVHAVRLAAKRLRYTLEFLAPVLGAGSNAAARAKRIAGLQDFLGSHQDAVVLLARLKKYARTIPHRDKALTLGAGSAMGALERASKVKRGALRVAWERALSGSG
ncbi:MAG TPA: CHAD domain-containing protein [Candidatus Eisenbacteria bacterium]|nr:CHAD domain-containing protein [Candidatus Eisenbacteria bacterium]